MPCFSLYVRLWRHSLGAKMARPAVNRFEPVLQQQQPGTAAGLTVARPPLLHTNTSTMHELRWNVGTEYAARGGRQQTEHLGRVGGGSAGTCGRRRRRARSLAKHIGPARRRRAASHIFPTGRTE